MTKSLRLSLNPNLSVQGAILCLIAVCTVMTSAQATPTVIWQEAETLSDTGRWSNDSQHVDFMGSPYLLATGVGYPVADAFGSVAIKEAGTYRLWVRCRDWYPSHSPGQFQVAIGGKKSAVTFGKAETDAWQWVDGGDFKLEAGETELRLTDLTGWWGRCDAIVLARGDFQPADELKTLDQQRIAHTGVSQEIKDSGTYDVVVVGGGSSGLGAAIGAARSGITVAFIQDRPVLGGNGSSEIMVPPVGRMPGSIDKVNVTGIAEEIFPEQQWTNFADSFHLEKLVKNEPNISLFLNTRATGVEMKNDTRIASVVGLNVTTGQRLRFKAPVFIDTTGHGWIGHYAGAEWRMGTEGRTEFGESLAPAEPNHYTMGNSLYRADFKDMGKPDVFEVPAWAYHYDSPDDFKKPLDRVKDIVRPEAFDKATEGPGRPVNVTGSKRGGAFTWYVEYGGIRNTITDAEKIRDELFRLHIGLWGYAKNYSEKGRKENENLRMTWLNYVPGVRESRRLVGDYIMTQKDYDEDLGHEDVVAWTEWGVDDHHPYGYFTDGIDAIHVYGAKRVPMVYRSFYSKNIENLFMAGRCMSTSHTALSGVRVQRPMAATGQVVGTAAALCKKYNTTPRGIYESHIRELQQTLIKDGCFLPGIKNEDPEDLALKAEADFPTLNDGWNREVRALGSLAERWRGKPIGLRWSSPQTIACVHLSLSNRHAAAAFAVDALVDGKWREMAKTRGKEKQRRYVINFAEPVRTDQVRFRLLRSTSSVAIAEIRAYEQPGNATTEGLPDRAGFPTDFDNRKSNEVSPAFAPASSKGS
jgi:hypothetical protein